MTWCDVQGVNRAIRSGARASPGRSPWRGKQPIQVEALAAWVERYDSGEWDDPPGKLGLLYDVERVREPIGGEPFYPERDRGAFVRFLIDAGCQPPPATGGEATVPPAGSVSCQGAGEVVVVGVTGDGVVLVACGLVGVVGLVLVVGVAVVVDVAGVVVVTVVGELVVVTVVVGLVFVSLCVEAPKNVVGWPLPVTECPAMRSGTVKSATTIANASRPVRTAARQLGRHAVTAVRLTVAGPTPAVLSAAACTRRGGRGCGGGEGG